MQTCEGRCNKTRERSEFDTVATILRVAGKGARITEIMHQCNVNRPALEKYLSALIESGLLKVEQKSQLLYRTSDTGLQFLRSYHRLKWLLWGETFDFLLVRILGLLRKSN
jgi:predicted transcriptional regulator